MLLSMTGFYCSHLYLDFDVLPCCRTGKGPVKRTAPGDIILRRLECPGDRSKQVNQNLSLQLLQGYRNGGQRITHSPVGVTPEHIKCLPPLLLQHLRLSLAPGPWALITDSSLKLPDSRGVSPKETLQDFNMPQFAF